jgi:hypothetical protein
VLDLHHYGVHSTRSAWLWRPIHESHSGRERRCHINGQSIHCSTSRYPVACLRFSGAEDCSRPKIVGWLDDWPDVQISGAIDSPGGWLSFCPHAPSLSRTVVNSTQTRSVCVLLAPLGQWRCGSSDNHPEPTSTKILACHHAVSFRAGPHYLCPWRRRAISFEPHLPAMEPWLTEPASRQTRHGTSRPAKFERRVMRRLWEP